MEKKKAIPKALVPLLSVAATAGSLYDIITKATGFLELLSAEGTGAFKTFIRPAIIGMIALIMSIAYVSSTGKSKALSSDKEVHLSRTNVVQRLLNTIVKTCIALVIIGIIATSVYGYSIYKEYIQRPEINVYDYIDLTPAISGYEGEATFNSDEVELLFPYDIESIYSNSNTDNYDYRKNYAEAQNAWNDFCDHLHFDYVGKTSGLTNNDEIVVTIDYQGKDLSHLKAVTHLKIKGVGKPKTYKIGDISELPYRFKDANQAKTEKGTVITDAENYIVSSVSGGDNIIEGCASFLCKPLYAKDSEPDALAVIVKYNYWGEVSYKYCFLYPFDSRASSDMISTYIEGFKFYVPPVIAEDSNELENDIRRGYYFDTETAYTLECIESKVYH